MIRYYCPFCGHELEVLHGEDGTDTFLCHDCEYHPRKDREFNLSEVMVYDSDIIYETCPKCDYDNEFSNWDVKRDGYIAHCEQCGKEIMLCDLCMHTDDDGNPCELNDYCDFHYGEGCELGSCYRMYFETRKE